MTVLFIVKSRIIDITTKRICITGGRNYPDFNRVWHVLDVAKQSLGDRMFLVVGCANGVDAYARTWAFDALRKDQYKVYEADWKAKGKAAGHLRNRAMLRSGLDMLIVFPGGVGTENMLKQVRDENRDGELIKILEVDR